MIRIPVHSLTPEPGLAHFRRGSDPRKKKKSRGIQFHGHDHRRCAHVVERGIVETAVRGWMRLRCLGGRQDIRGDDRGRQIPCRSFLISRINEDTLHIAKGCHSSRAMDTTWGCLLEGACRICIKRTPSPGKCRRDVTGLDIARRYY